MNIKTKSTTDHRIKTTVVCNSTSAFIQSSSGSAWCNTMRTNLSLTRLANFATSHSECLRKSFSHRDALIEPDMMKTMFSKRIAKKRNLFQPSIATQMWKRYRLSGLSLKRNELKCLAKMVILSQALTLSVLGLPLKPKPPHLDFKNSTSLVLTDPVNQP